jgi:hypothetical protein
MVQPAGALPITIRTIVTGTDNHMQICASMETNGGASGAHCLGRSCQQAAEPGHDSTEPLHHSGLPHSTRTCVPGDILSPTMHVQVMARGLKPARAPPRLRPLPVLCRAQAPQHHRGEPYPQVPLFFLISSQLQV